MAAGLSVGGSSKDLYEDLRRKFAPIGAVSHKKVGVTDLFKIMRAARDADDFKVAMKTMNRFYNFGVKLKHREIASRFLALAMLTSETAEAAELVRLYGTWLENPPSKALVYAVMGHFLDAGDAVMVRSLAKAVREDWRMPLEAPLYALASEAMLSLPDPMEALHEAAALHEDAARMGVRLPAPVHLRLLDAAMKAYDAGLPSEGAAGDASGPEVPVASSVAPAVAEVEVLAVALKAADALARDGHLRGGANAATLCSLSWLFWRLASLPEACRAQLPAAPDFKGRDWVRCFEAAAANFGCHWGHASRLPVGFFDALKASRCPDSVRALRVAKRRFGRFCPASVTAME